MLMDIGGFGKFQCRVVTCFIMTLMSGFWYQYPISFLELTPKFECLYANDTLQGYVPCNTTDFCGDDQVKS